MYRLIRPALFALDSERVHKCSLRALAAAAGPARVAYGRRMPPVPVRAMGIDFPNPVGLAAGLDKDGSCIDGLAALGFGFLEVGTVTPRAQPGNPRPRLFRLPAQRALINRMGFNNRGVSSLVARLKAHRFQGIVGVNIGKNFDTPLARAVDDYLYCLRALYADADYVAVNVSSPNTVGLRELQGADWLARLLPALKRERAVLADRHGRYLPLAIKVAPDLEAGGLEAVAAAVKRHGFDAVIAANTTLARPGLDDHPLAGQAGGLSGAPLATAANAAIATLAGALDGAVPIVGVGGIMSGADARAKIDAGATLVQLYTGLIYRGPALVGECVRALA